MFCASFHPSLTMPKFLGCDQKHLPAWLVRIRAHSPSTTVSRRTEKAIPVVLGIGADKLLRCTWIFAPFIGQLWWHHLLWNLGCCTRRLHSLLWDLQQQAQPCLSKSKQFLSFFLFKTFHSFTKNWASFRHFSKKIRLCRFFYPLINSSPSSLVPSLIDSPINFQVPCDLFPSPHPSYYFCLLFPSSSCLSSFIVYTTLTTAHLHLYKHWKFRFSYETEHVTRAAY